MKYTCICLFAVAMALANLVGCKDNGKPTVKVAGHVTFSGQSPPYEGTLSFISIERVEGLPQRDGSAQYDEEGAFLATSFKRGDGLLPGKYRIEVNSYKYPPETNKPNGFAEASAIDPSFTPPEIVIEKGKPLSDLLIDVPLKK